MQVRSFDAYMRGYFARVRSGESGLDFLDDLSRMRPLLHGNGQYAALKCLHVVQTVDACFRPRKCDFSYFQSLSAARKLAQIVGGISTNDQPRYHNTSHFLDVFVASAMLCALYTCARDTSRTFQGLLTPADCLDLSAVMGLSHDLGHPGGGNTQNGVLESFRLEKQSWNLLEPVLLGAGYNEKRRTRLHHVLMLTDPTVGPKLIECALRYHEGAQESAERAALDHARKYEGTDDLWKALCADKKLVVMAHLFTKADIAMSLTPAWNREMTHRLHEEHSVARTGVSLLDEAGRPTRGGFGYFLEHIVCAKSNPPYFSRSMPFLNRAFGRGIARLRGRILGEALPTVQNPLIRRVPPATLKP